jgi:hypothetical protein
MWKTISASLKALLAPRAAEMCRLSSGAVGSGLILLLVIGCGEAYAAEPRVMPAIDGVLAAFKDHPLVGLGDAHGLAEEGVFYEQLVRDPRFAAEVGSVVFEAASSAHQATLDRYLDGQNVPRAELRRVWSDAVGWGSPPSVMYQQFLAAVREVNLKLPRASRIHVWAGEPPADWTQITTQAQLEPFLNQRDQYAAEVIEKHILERGKKALVIYGALHFYALPNRPEYPPNAGLRGLIEGRRPNAFYVVQPYFGYFQAECSARFEAETGWPAGSLIAPVRGTSLQPLLLRDGCTVAPPPRPAPGSAPMTPEALARLQAGFLRPMSGADADALLYLAPAASLTLATDDPDLTSDPAYAAEITRRMLIMGGPPDFLSHLVTTRQPYRRYPKATSVR